MRDPFTRNLARGTAVVGIFFAGFLVGSAATAKADTLPECPGTLVLAVDGTKDPHTVDSIDPASPLNPIADRYRTHPDTRVEHIAYPGGMIDGVNGWTANYEDSVAAGSQNLRIRIRDNEAQCGDTTRYILIGYSQGARIVGDIAAEIDSDRVRDDGRDLQDRTTVYLYADPCQPRTGIEPLLAATGSLLPGIDLAGPRPPYQNVPVTWVCTPGDGVCDATPNLLATFVGYVLNHENY